MLFVDGENFAIRSKNVAAAMGVSLTSGDFYEPDVFVWMPGFQSRKAPGGAEAGLRPRATRAYYFTSVQGDENKVNAVREALWKLRFEPVVFKKTQGRTKGVDIALTTELLTHAFHDSYDAAVLVAGDADYVRAVNAVKQRGKQVYVAFFEHPVGGLSPELRLASDTLLSIDSTFQTAWRDGWPKYLAYIARKPSNVAPAP